MNLESIIFIFNIKYNLVKGQRDQTVLPREDILIQKTTKRPLGVLVLNKKDKKQLVEKCI